MFQAEGSKSGAEGKRPWTVEFNFKT